MQWKYNKDYEYQDVTDKDGKISSRLVYTGTYYETDLSEAEIFSFRREGLISSISALLLFCSGGLFPSGAGRDFRVMIPWMITFLCLTYFLWGTVNLLRVPVKMTRHQYEDSYGRTARSCLLAAFFTIITSVMDIIFLITAHERTIYPGDIIFLISILLILCITVSYFLRNQRRLNSAVPIHVDLYDDGIV